jgi:hypothetical protein
MMVDYARGRKLLLKEIISRVRNPNYNPDNRVDVAKGIILMGSKTEQSYKLGNIILNSEANEAKSRLATSFTESLESMMNLNDLNSVELSEPVLYVIPFSVPKIKVYGFETTTIIFYEIVGQYQDAFAVFIRALSNHAMPTEKIVRFTDRLETEGEIIARESENAMKYIPISHSNYDTGPFEPDTNVVPTAQLLKSLDIDLAELEFGQNLLQSINESRVQRKF